MAKVIDVGGRYFTPATETSARQDGWLLVQASDAGIMAFAEQVLDEKVAQQLIVQILRSGKRGHLLAGVLVEPEHPWTPQNAEANAEYFESITDPAAKAALWDALLPTLVDFFRNAPLSSADSRTVSSEAAAPRKRRPKQPVAPSTAPAVPVQAPVGVQ